MASALMKSISGIRGIVGETVTPDLIVKVGSAFARYTKKGKIIIGRDSRPSGEAISDGMKSVLSLSGCSVIDIGIVPTPTVQIIVEEFKAAGGIVISASHNPIEWNAFKLITSSGLFLNSKEMKKFFELMDGNPEFVKWDRIGRIDRNNSAGEIHINRVLEVLDRASIRNKKFKIVLDSVNGAGSVVTQNLLHELGCETVPLYCDMNGEFPRGAEPLAENLKDLAQAVIKHGADIGFAQDPDADRLAIVDEKGRPIGEEYTLALVTEHMLSMEKGRVVTNLSTTRAIDDIAARYDVQVKRTQVGEINVADEMKKRGARIGGEGNGGVISPEVHLGRDSLVGIGYILQMMADRDKSLSMLMSELPQYVMKKGKIKFDKKKSLAPLLSGIQKTWKMEKISSIDGLRIDFKKHPEFKGGWVHLRPSNTEPVFRIISEGKDPAHAEAIYKHFEKMIILK